jgi:hypothetical protein
MKKHTILFLAANPLGTSEAALADEARAIQAELELAGHRDRFEFVTRWAVQPLDLLRELRKLKPTVVHFTGQRSRSAIDMSPAGDTPHHDVTKDLDIEKREPQQQGLFFRGPDNRPLLVSIAALEETFEAAGESVQLVVLNACYSDPQAGALAAHVDCVVGIAGSVLDDAARYFAIGFYGGLGERESIAAAYKQGRAAISLAGLREGDRPKLKVRGGVDASRIVLAGDPT